MKKILFIVLILCSSNSFAVPIYYDGTREAALAHCSSMYAVCQPAFTDFSQCLNTQAQDQYYAMASYGPVATFKGACSSTGYTCPNGDVVFSASDCSTDCPTGYEPSEYYDGECRGIEDGCPVGYHATDAYSGMCVTDENPECPAGRTVSGTTPAISVCFGGCVYNNIISTDEHKTFVSNGNVCNDPPSVPLEEEDGTVTAPDGTVTSPDGTVTAPDGTVTSPDGTVTAPDGTVTAPNGSVTSPDGTVTHPDGTVVSPDGTITDPDGEVTSPDGTVTAPDGTVTSPDGTVTETNGRVTDPDGTVHYPDGSVTNPDGSVDFPDGTSIDPDGTVTAPDGTVTQPDGTVTTPDGTSTSPDGTVTTPDGTSTSPDGTVTTPDGTSTSPDGTVTKPDGTKTDPDGTVTHPDGSVTHPDGSETPPPEEGTDPTASGGDTCGSPPVCDGDAVGCAILAQEWKTRCESLDNTLIDEGTIENTAFSDFIAEYTTKSGDSKNTLLEKINVISAEANSMFEYDLPGSGGVLPTNIVDIFGVDVDFSVAKFSDQLQVIAAALVVLSLLLSALIVMGKF